MVGPEEMKMYTGTLIDDLISTVENISIRIDDQLREAKLAYWYATAEREWSNFESSLAGVA